MIKDFRKFCNRTITFFVYFYIKNFWYSFKTPLKVIASLTSLTNQLSGIQHPAIFRLIYSMSLLPYICNENAQNKTAYLF